MAFSSAMNVEVNLQELPEQAESIFFWSVGHEKMEFRKVSEGLLKISGRQKATLLELIHPADLDYFLTAVHLLDKKSRQTFQHRILSQDLKSYNFQTEIWKSGNGEEISGVSVLLTSQKTATSEENIEDIVLKSQNFFNHVIENIPHMVFVKEVTELRFVYFNRAGEELLGIPREEIIGKNDYDFFPREQADFFANVDRLVISGKKNMDISEEKLCTRKGDRIVRTKKIPLIGEDGKTQFILGFSEDITEWKRSENERLEMLREQIMVKEHASSREKASFLANAHNILSSSLDYNMTLEKLAKIMIPFLGDWCTITILNEDGSFSRAAAHHKDLSKQFLVSELKKYTPKVFPGSGTFQSVLKEGNSVLMTEVKNDDLRALAQNEDHYLALEKLGCKSAMTVPIIYRDRIHGAISIIISDSNRSLSSLDLAIAEELGMRAGVAIENALLYQTAQKAIAVRDEFLSIASHELKTPVTSLKLLLQMTRKGVRPEEEVIPTAQKLASSLDKADGQINRLTNLIEDLLDTSRIQMGKIEYVFQKINFSELLTEMCESYREHLHSHGCTLLTKIENNIFVHGDRMRLEQVILNILTNAAKYGNEKPVHVGLSIQEGQCVLSIKDHGLGIRKDKLERIFDRFERAISSKNISGLGLGLYISREIVHAHGGKIFAKNGPSEGAEFIVQLPF